MIGNAPMESVIEPKSFNSRMNAPKIAGMETMNENSPAAFLFTPEINAPAIVEPLLEIAKDIGRLHAFVKRLLYKLLHELRSAVLKILRNFV